MFDNIMIICRFADLRYSQILAHLLLRRLPFGPFPDTSGYYALCWLLHSGQEISRLPQSRFRDTIMTSRGKFDNLHRTPAEFTALDFDGYGLCYLWPTRPARTASYSVSVRQVTALLHTSLEPCLTAALLRFANTSTSKLSNMLGIPKKRPV